MVNRLKEYREKANLSIVGLQDKSGVSRVTISKIENDPKYGCNTNTLEILSEALNHPVRDIFF